MPLKTHSEELFAKYLRSRGFLHFQYHPRLPNSSKRPDFLLRFAGQEVICEVAEFDGPSSTLGVRNRKAGAVESPHFRVVRKIQEEWRQLKDFSGYCCCMVFYDSGQGIPVLEPDFIFEAMFGRLQINIPFNPKTGASTRDSFVTFSKEGGEMRWDSGARRKPHVSAIVVIDEYPAGERLFFATSARLDENLSSQDQYVERWREMERVEGTNRDISRRELRAVVYEVPFSERRIPRGLFAGPFDERYGVRRGKTVRTFVGREIREIEAKAGVPRSPLVEFLKRKKRP